MTSIREIIDRLNSGEVSNELDVLIEIAIFKPCERHASVRANNAGTKLIYTDTQGSSDTFRAYGWSEYVRDGTVDVMADLLFAASKEANP